MTDTTPPPDPTTPETAPVTDSPVADAPEAPAAPQRTPLRDRVLGLRAVVAVALASVILGGAGGAVLGAVGAGSDDGVGRTGPGPFNRQPPGGGMPDRLPPSTAPDDDTQDS